MIFSEFAMGIFLPKTPAGRLSPPRKDKYKFEGVLELLDGDIRIDIEFWFAIGFRSIILHAG